MKITDSVQVLITALLLLACIPGAAAEPVNIYSGEVTVTDQTEATRSAAIGQAFDQVLAKLSGRRQVTNVAGLSKYRNDASRYLQGFGYQRYQVPINPTRQFDQLRLVASFDQRYMDRVLTELRLPRWSTDRPNFQLWVALDDMGNRVLLGENEAYLRFMITDSAQRRGLPLELGAQDPADPKPRLQDIWGGFVDGPMKIARAGGFQGVGLAAAQARAGAWEVRWNLAAGADRWSFRSRGASLADAFAAGVHRAADEVAASYAIGAAAQGQWTENIDVVNLSGGHEYTRCINYLQSLSLVSRVDVVEAQGARVRFRLELNAAPEYFFDRLRRNQVLASLGSQLPGAARTFELSRLPQ